MDPALLYTDRPPATRPLGPSLVNLIEAGAEQDKRLANIADRISTIADHLCGSSPALAAGGDREKSPPGALGRLNDQRTYRQSTLQRTEFSLRRIEAAIGVGGPTSTDQSE